MPTHRILLAALAAGVVLLVFAGSRPASAQPLIQQLDSGGIYYVSPGGNDANLGTITQPWRTIQKAANTLVAGDTVYVRTGTYPEQVIPQNSGSDGNYITYAAYPGETATIDGSGITLPDDLAGLFHISGKEYLRVSGLRIVNAGPNDNNAGILVLDSSHILVENNSTYHTKSSGVGVWGSNNVTADGNRIEEAGGGGGKSASASTIPTFRTWSSAITSSARTSTSRSPSAQVFRCRTSPSTTT